MNWFDVIWVTLQSYGYFGMFILGIVGNAVPFLTVPFLIPVFFIAGMLDPLLLGISVGVGSAFGKCVSYAIGRGGVRIFGEKKQNELKVFSELLGKYGAVAVYIFTFLPLPDDIIIIPFGMAKYSFKKFFIALLAGKLTLALLVSYAGRYSIEYLTVFIGGGDAVIGTVLSVIFMVLMIVVIAKINWIEATEHVQHYGLWSYVRLLMKRIFASGSKGKNKGGDDKK